MPPQPSARPCSGNHLTDLSLDPVVERVVDIDPEMPVERLVTDDRSRTLRALGEVIQAIDDQGGMSLASREELRIDPELDLDAVILKPAASSLLQMGA